MLAFRLLAANRLIIGYYRSSQNQSQSCGTALGGPWRATQTIDRQYSSSSGFSASFSRHTDPSPNFFLLSSLRSRVLHKILFWAPVLQVLRGLVLSAIFRIIGSCKVLAINKVSRLGGEDGGGDITWVVIHRVVLVGSSAAILFCPLITPLG